MAVLNVFAMNWLGAPSEDREDKNLPTCRFQTAYGVKTESLCLQLSTNHLIHIGNNGRQIRENARLG